MQKEVEDKIRKMQETFTKIPMHFTGQNPFYMDYNHGIDVGNVLNNGIQYRDDTSKKIQPMTHTAEEIKALAEKMYTYECIPDMPIQNEKHKYGIDKLRSAFINGYTKALEEEQNDFQLRQKIEERINQISKDDMIHPSTQAAILRELKRFESWLPITHPVSREDETK